MAFGLLRILARLERTSRSLALATFATREIEALSVAEWESFGESDFAGHQEMFAWERTFFAAHIRPGDRLLVVGAGNGREVVPLIEAGHQVTGLDIAPRALQILLRRVEQSGQKVEIIHGSITEAPLPQRAFDVVLFSWFCYGYLLGPSQRQTALARAQAALRPGGRILISYQPRTTVTPPPFPRLARWVAVLLGSMEPEEGDHFSISGRAGQPHVLYVHSFTAAEIADAARRAGLRVVFHDQPSTSLARLALARDSESSG